MVVVVAVSFAVVVDVWVVVVEVVVVVDVFVVVAVVPLVVLFEVVAVVLLAELCDADVVVLVVADVVVPAAGVLLPPHPTNKSDSAATAERNFLFIEFFRPY